MGTTQTMNMSPLSAIGGTLGLLAGAGQNYGNIAKSLGGIGDLFKGLGFGSGSSSGCPLGCITINAKPIDDPNYGSSSSEQGPPAPGTP